MTTHARIAPSALALTVACNASVQLQEAVPPQPDTEEEAEGTVAHIVAMRAASGHPAKVGDKIPLNGRTWIVDNDMVNGARRYADALGGPHGALRLEDGVRCSAIHPTESWGTPDGWRYIPEGTGPLRKPVLRVGDYKYGHRYIEVFENFQLIAYAAGIMERLVLTDPGLILELILVQPRAYHRDGPVRIWRVTYRDIEHLIDRASREAHAALESPVKATTGLHCRDCRARHICATFRETTTNIVDFSGTAEPQPLDDISMGQELHTIDAAIERLQARRTGLAVHVEAALRSGRNIPHYQLEAGKSNRQWNPDASVEDIATLGDMVGVALRKPLALVTPKQAIDAGIDEGIIELYSHRPPGALKLVPADTIQTRKIFGASNT